MTDYKSVNEKVGGRASIVAVSKFHPYEAVVEAYNEGAMIFGENRVQEMRDKFPPKNERPEGMKVYLIGQLQRNKVRKALEWCDRIESVDSIPLIDKIEKECEAMDIFIDPSTPEKAAIFDGTDGTMYWNYDGKGHIGYERKGYSYIMPYELPEGKRMKLTLICDRTTLYLLVNGKRVAQGVYADDPDRVPDSSTFVMPVEHVCPGIRGTLYNLKFTNNIPEVF